jgi:cell pole-organizing protein PopZ
MMRELDTPRRAEPAPQEPEDILELTEPMTAPPPPSIVAPPQAASLQVADTRSDAIVNDRPPTPVPPPREEPPRRAFSPVAEHALLSSAATTAVDSAFSTLAHTVLVQNARTLEDLVHDMLRPMLKAWLDDNLPGMVERIVRAEIERVSRGRG